MAADDLHVMLGLPLDTRPADLRLAYERAVDDAARSHNIRRATQLSSAFDRLPFAVRESLYASRGVGVVPVRHRRRRSVRLGWFPAVVMVVFVGAMALHFAR